MYRNHRLRIAGTLSCLPLLAFSSIAFAQTPAQVPAQPQTKAQARAARMADFLDEVTTHFATWDKDGNKELSQAELSTIAADTKVTGKEAAAIAVLKRVASSKKFAVPTMTLDNIRSLTETQSIPNQPNLVSIYTSSLSKITKAKHSLFESGKPNLAVVHQGNLGDCFCLAPLGAMLSRDPQQVASMFQPQADGTYQITLGKQTVSVSAPTDAEIAIAASTEQDGYWVNLYEKAVGKAYKPATSVDNPTGSPIDGVAKGGSAGTILGLITGHKIDRFSCRFAHDEKLSAEAREAKMQDLRDRLTHAVADKRLITAGTQTTTTPGLTPHHAYAVLAYDAATDSLRLWNPHGNKFTPKGTPGLTEGYPCEKGIFTIPLKDFVDQFTGLAFETTDTAL